MDDIRQYVTQIVAAAMVCGILSGLFQKGTYRDILRIFCGLVLTFTLLRPIVGLNLSEILEQSMAFEADAQRSVSQGENMAREALAERITQATEAYILDKAAEWNAAVTAQVTLSADDPPRPVKAEISGELSPYAKTRLEAFLESELGIARENQLWTG